MTTTNEVMRLMHIADEFAVATGRNLTGDAFRSRAALSTVVEALVSERDAARAALAPAVPPGYVLVPVEPTPEMCAAAVRFANGDAVYKNVVADALKIEEGIYGEVYAAMCAAAPSAKETQT